jgi:hypothetical protein
MGCDVKAVNTLEEVHMRLFIPILAAAVISATACNANDATSPTVSIAGTWSLRTLNGSPLPTAVSSNTSIISEQLTLNNDGSYSDVAAYTDGTTFNEFGYYSVNNNLITFNDQTDRITYSGSISGNVLTEVSSNGQFTSVYQKN